MTDDSAKQVSQDAVAFEYELRRRDVEDEWHTTIQTTHPEEVWSDALSEDMLEYRNVRELVYRD